MKKESRIQSYHKIYLDNYGFEAEIVQARQKMILEILRTTSPKTVVEVSCGPELLYNKVLSENIPIAQWIIVEPNAQFVEKAQNNCKSPEQLSIIQGFFEDSIEQIKQQCSAPIDLIILAGILNEVDNPRDLLKAAQNILAPKGTIHINVPNALSLHRQLGKAMSLIKHENELSPRNKTLKQPQVFDMEKLKKLMIECKLSIKDTGGYFIKPFSHEQMTSIQSILSQEVLNGLWTLGRDHPEMATEIYINAGLGEQ